MADDDDFDHRVQSNEPRGDEDRPFTPAERKQLRELLTADQRRQWVVSTIKTIAVWVSAVAAAIVVLQDYIRKALHVGGAN